MAEPDLGDLPVLLDVERDMDLHRLGQELEDPLELLLGVGTNSIIERDVAADVLDVHGSPFAR